jgi:hypothetical protein
MAQLLLLFDLWPGVRAVADEPDIGSLAACIFVINLMAYLELEEIICAKRRENLFQATWIRLQEEEFFPESLRFLDLLIFLEFAFSN